MYAPYVVENYLKIYCKLNLKMETILRNLYPFLTYKALQ